ncbi:hypothetical protein C0992_002724 [Termitomyces sp. T32_za158]|nr:hypothetical protein C0992_002724 [Termitomyces sp. T32_za158]
MKDCISGGFIEDEFLSKTSKDLRKCRATSGSNSETSSSLSGRMKAKNSQTLQKTMRSAPESVNSSPSITKVVPGTIKLDGKEPTESITWDIERESVILSSHISTSVSEEAISVLLDTKNALWSKVPVDALHDVPLLGCQAPLSLPLVTPSDNTEPSHESLSIGPSESASQRVNLSPILHDLREAASRYFVSAPQPQPSEELSEGVTCEVKPREVVTIEPLAHGLTHMDEKHDLSLALTSDVICQVQDRKKREANSSYDLLPCDLDDLPFVEPQDYKYSDYNFQTGLSEDSDCDEVLQSVLPSYSELDEQQTHTKGFFTLQSDVLELAGPLEFAYPEEVEPTVYGEQNYNQEESLDDDEYDASDCKAEFSLSSRVPHELWNERVVYNTEWDLEELEFNLGKSWQGMGEVNNVDNSSNSVNLDTCINSDLESRESVDLIGTFTEGKALLCGWYSEAEACASYSSIPCRQIQVSAAEADVAKRLKNHWLPRRL